ncbi:MAG: diguanylate cyclase [Candidatus Aureabacteria bacterium]|nr:diguanylate cyclase [Candidatus Auribacterota bacterium]
MKQKIKKKRILCLHEKKYTYDSIRQILANKNYFVYDYSDAKEAVSHVYNEPPDIIIVSTKTIGWEDFMTTLKNDSAYKHLPLILLTREETLDYLLSIPELLCDDFILFPVRPEEVLLRIQLRESSGSLNLDANPLTRLPGNYTIMANIQKIIGVKKSYALCYVDLDNFKAFNDRYGFARGDEAIRMTAKIITNVVRRLSSRDSFVGHVGGDDFFFIVPSSIVKETCKQMIQNFDMVIPTLINEKDRIRGYIESKDRKGSCQRFPLLSISLAVVDLKVISIKHPGEASVIASEIKKEVKKLTGSNYMINRRGTS